jgi:hypothetical protein
MMLLFVIALARRRRSRYRVLRQAMDDGLARRMGVSQEFPL